VISAVYSDEGVWVKYWSWKSWGCTPDEEDDLPARFRDDETKIMYAYDTRQRIPSGSAAAPT
jgi:hypothetical protein